MNRFGSLRMPPIIFGCILNAELQLNRANQVSNKNFNILRVALFVVTFHVRNLHIGSGANLYIGEDKLGVIKGHLL